MSPCVQDGSISSVNIHCHDNCVSTMMVNHTVMWTIILPVLDKQEPADDAGMGTELSKLL